MERKLKGMKITGVTVTFTVTDVTVTLLPLLFYMTHDIVKKLKGMKITGVTVTRLPLQLLMLLLHCYRYFFILPMIS